MRFFRQFQHLLPRTEAWSLVAEKQLRKLFEALAQSPTADAVEFVDDVWLDIFPETTRELEKWEQQFQLDGGGTDTARRLALAARWQAQGGQDPQYIQDTLQAAGFDAYVHEWWETEPETRLTYSLESGSVGTQDTFPTGLWFSAAGDKCYVAGNTGQDINGYTLSTPWDVSTLGSPVVKDTSPQNTSPMAVMFSADGGTMFMLGVNTNQVIYQYNVPTPWDITSATYASKTLFVSPQDNLPRGMTFNDDGSLLLVIGQQNNKIYQYELPFPYTLTSYNYSGVSMDTSGADTGMTGVAFTGDGNYIEAISASSDSIWQWKLGTPYDISTAGLPVEIGDVSNEETIPQDMFVRQATGDTYIVGSNADTVFRYGRSVNAYRDTGNSFFLAGGGTEPQAIYMRADGAMIFTVHGQFDLIVQGNLATPFDISTTTVGTFGGVGIQEGNPTGISFSEDGTLMFIYGDTDKVRSYSLFTPWDVATLSATGDELDVSAHIPTVTGDMFFKPDGTALWVCGQNASASGVVVRYNLSSPWDITTGVYAGETYITAETTTPYGLWFGDSGFSMWIADDDGNLALKYTLAIQYDITTATFDSSLDPGFSNPSGICLSQNSNNLYVLDRSTRVIDQYSRLQPRDPRDYTNQPLIGLTQCGDTGAECGEQPPGQTSVSSAVCSDLLANDVFYLVNKDLTRRAPPPVPDDPQYWPYFLYFGGEVFPTAADIQEGNRDAFEELLLTLCPTQHWIVTLVDFSNNPISLIL